MKFLSKFTCTVALASCLSVLGTNASAQDQENDIEIKIVNRDGEEVNSAEVQLAPGVNGAAAAGGVSITNKDGKITIVDSNGERREIDVSDAQSIIVNQSVRSIMKNGEEKRETFGKAIIIGPDGTRQEIELAPGQPAPMVFGKLNPGGRWNQIQAQPVQSGFMIGVNCSTISEVLSKQLQLEPNIGLVVESVAESTPSSEAGIKEHDILMYAADQQLSTIKDLTDLIQVAGKDKSKISITLLRAGKEVSVEVTPTERPAGNWNVIEAPGGTPFPPNADFQFRRLAPGVIMGSGFEESHKQMEEQMKAVREQMEQLRKEMRERFERDNLLDKDNF